MSALSVFATPPLGGFNSRGAHPEGGTIYGGAETALCELIRGGHAVIRQMEWHDDENGDLGEKAQKDVVDAHLSLAYGA